MKKILKRVLLALGVLLLLSIGTAFAIPYFFKDQILAKAKTAINANLNAKVDFADANLSMFSTFPNLGLSMDNFSVEGIDAFSGVKLAEIKKMTLVLDFWSVWNGMNPIKITSVKVIDPKIHVLVTKEGLANYNVSKPTTDTSTTSTDFKINLEDYQVSNGRLIYDDASMGVYVAANGINHQGSGDLTASIYDLITTTKIDTLDVTYGGIAYLNNATANLDAIFHVDQNQSKYTLKDNNLVLNALHLTADGWVQLPNEEDVLMDIKFNTPENDFRNLFSIIPGAYLKGYEQVKVDGKFDLNGEVKGTYNSTREQMPAFSINLGVDNGRVKYPDLPLAISNINAKGNISSPGSDLDQMKINFSKFALKIGSNPIDSRFILKTPLSDPDVDAKVKGILNLGELAKAFPMEGLDELRGKITADVVMRARQSQIEKQQYEQVDMQGNARIQGMTYRGMGYPAINIQDAQMSFSPQFVDLARFVGTLGKSDLQASGRINNILAYFSPNKTMTGNLTARSHYFNANEWIPAEEPSGTVTAASLSGSTPASTEVFDRFDFGIDAQVDKLVYDKYELLNSTAKGQISPNRMTITSAATQIKDSDMAVDGTITNVFDYLFKGGNLGGNINLTSRKLDLNQFMTDFTGTPSTAPAPETPSAEYGVILVPDNINLSINAAVGEVQYTNMTLNNLNGNLQVADKAVELRDVNANTLGGNIGFAGLYDTKNGKNPLYNMRLDLNKMDFQKSFKTFNSFRILAPIGAYINGLFNTSLVLKGSLKDNMMPDLATVDAKGFLETVNGVVKGFKPLEMIGQALDIAEIKKEVFLNTKNWVAIREGGIDVSAFDVKVKDIQMTIAGRHTINQVIDYTVKMKIPRKYLDQNAVGKAAAVGLKQLKSQASKIGLELQESEFVNVLVNLTGNVGNPKAQFQLLAGDGKSVATDVAKDAINKELDDQKQKLEAEAKKKIAEVENKAKDMAGKAADSLRNAAQREYEKKKAELEAKAREKLGKEIGGKVTDTLTKKAQEKLGNVIDKGKAQEEIDKAKKELEKFNPFKKKNKPADTTGVKKN
jgi:hypothetical protein